MSAPRETYAVLQALARSGTQSNPGGYCNASVASTPHYRSFSYTKQTHDVKVGPIEMSVQDKQTVNVPVWAGVGAIMIGAALLLFGARKP